MINDQIEQEINIVKKKIAKPWNEKYRPKELYNLAQQVNIQKIVNHAQITSKMPHLLLYGPPGCGKTTTGLAICKQYYYNPHLSNVENDKIFFERVLELNASDERGIQFVKGQIKTFAEQMITKRDNMPNFKLIILDECDAMTNDSQFALRRIMEDYSENTRFILICNYVKKIITPIRSRTLMFRYQHITVDEMDKIINHIAENENIVITNEFIRRLHMITRGDLRKGVNILEQCATTYPDMSLESLNECSGMINIDFFNNIIKTITTKSTTILNIQDLTMQFTNEAFLLSSLIQELFNFVLTWEIPENIKVQLIIIIANADASINKGSNEYMVLNFLFTNFHSLLNF